MYVCNQSTSVEENVGDLCSYIVTLCSEATVILIPVTKRGILKSLVSHVLNLKRWSNSFVTQLVSVCNFVINLFNPTF